MEYYPDSIYLRKQDFNTVIFSSMEENFALLEKYVVSLDDFSFPSNKGIQQI